MAAVQHGQLHRLPESHRHVMKRTRVAGVPHSPQRLAEMTLEPSGSRASIRVEQFNIASGSCPIGVLPEFSPT
ncbi:hypothetical protein [Cupriavidus sp. 8B]